MSLLRLEELSIGFRGPTLLDAVTCTIGPGERIGLLGRNGSGKTTLMRMIAGVVPPDHGRLKLAPDARVALLPQEVPDDLEGEVRDLVAEGLMPRAEDPPWLAEQRLDRIIERMSLPTDRRFEALSAGLKRRVLLARAIVAEPDLLLLDEPTNHLDVASIEWLEEFLSRWPKSFLFVTHDRAFLRRLATRILEIDRGRLFDWSCDYDTFLARKEAALVAEEKQQALFDKKLAEEEVWIRQGIKARRTRNEGRVRALEAMRVERSQRRDKTGNVRLTITEAERSGALVADVRDLSFAYGDRCIVSDFSTRIMRGDKIGILGPNGAGKTTLLRLLLGQLKPQSGTVRLGTRLQVVYFDQLRGTLNEQATVVDEVGEGNDTVRLGEGSRHVIGYLKDFLFTAERARTPIRFLSGGERNRVLLAKLFTRPANVIVLDEPTNDLDAETLEILESRLVEFGGTVLVVSHDRDFLDHVVGSTLVFEEGNVREYDGGYSDWVRQRAARGAPTAGGDKGRAFDRNDVEKRASGETPRPAVPASSGAGNAAKKLSFKERRELEELPGMIERTETEIAARHETMAQPEFYKRDGAEIATFQAELQSLESRLAAAYARWEELEARDG
ncbi:MAG TPA: ABC transporter ATP-binding protein [Planctomycetaceae bacterium]|nr:ABC transporter ATP-binding protein [Planctomycetaceae bacterium]